MMKSGRLVVVAGAGDLGGRLAVLRARRGDEVLCVRRSAAGSGDGIRRLSADLVSGAGLQRLPARPDAIVFCAAPDARTESAYRGLFVGGVQRLLDASGEPGRFVMVSSTAVYGEAAGEHVDETTPERPSAFNGQVLLEAEQALMRRLPPAVVLRCSGLYGPGRTSVLHRARSATAARPHWSNRIHVADAADALSRLLDLEHPRPVYLGNDDRPSREDELFGWIRDRLGLDPLPAPVGPDTGRRVDNSLLRASGWTPRHPDFEHGYAGLLASLAGAG